MDGFDTELNAAHLRNTADVQSATVSDMIGGTVASVVDFGATVWNSMPLTTNVETGDLLKSIGGDALRVYEENPDTIHTASFIGGMFVPAGLSIKGMQAMRAGVKGVNWFSKAGKEASLKEADDMFRAAGAGTKEYRSHMRELYAKNFANEAIDSIAAEAAVVLTMSAHPLMEDYMEDPVKNFAIGAAFGGVLGGTVGTIADHYTIRQLTGTAASESLTKLFDQTIPVYENMPRVMAFQASGVNIANYQKMIDLGLEANKTPLNDLTLDYASKAIISAQADQARMFDEIVAPEIRNSLDTEQLADLKALMQNSPEMFGVVKMSPVDGLSLTTKKSKDFEDLKAKPTLSVSELNPDGTIGRKNVKSVYYPEAGVYGTTNDLGHYAGANTISTKADDFDKRLGKSFGKAPDDSHDWELMSSSSAKLEGDYIGALVRVNRMDAADLGKLWIDENDAPLLNAVVAKIRSMGDEGFDIKIKVGKMEGNKTKTKTIVSQELKDMHKNGMPEDFANKLSKEFNENSIRTNYEPAFNSDAYWLKEDWTGGKYAVLREGARLTSRRRNDAARLDKLSDAEENAVTAYNKLYNDPGQVAARKKLAEISDNGHVWLYRGIRTEKLDTQLELESMTTNYGKAKEFSRGGNVQLYKIPVEDVKFVINDFGKPGNDQAEFLVGISPREAQAVLSNDGAFTYRRPNASGVTNIQNISAGSVPEWDINRLAEAQITNKITNIHTLAAEGIPLESIALRTNTPKDYVELIISQNLTATESMNILSTVNLNKNFDLDSVNKTLSPLERPVILEGNVRQNAFNKMVGNLDSANLQQINDTFIDTVLRGSKNDIVRDYGKFLTEDMSQARAAIKAALSKGNNQFGGNAFLGSFDFVTRNMGDLGPMISHIGKEVQTKANLFTDRITSLLQANSEAIKKEGVASVVEFNTVKQLNDSLKGWRTYKDGQIFQKVMKEGADGKQVEVLEAVKYGGAEFSIKSPANQKMLSELQDQSRELLELSNASKKILGNAPTNDIGLWMPTFNPVGKHLSYLHNPATDQTSVIWANSAAELETMEKTWGQRVLTDPVYQGMQVIRKGVEQAEWSRQNGRLDTVNMTVADSSKMKGGSASSALPGADMNVFADMANGYQHYVNAQFRNLTDVVLSDVTTPLRLMSELNTWGKSKDQPLTMVQKVAQKDKDIAQTLLNNLLGNGSLNEYQGWKSVNQTFESGLSMVLNKAGAAYDTTIGKVLEKKGTLATKDYEDYAAAAEKAGMFNPFKGFDDEAAKMFGLAKLEDHPDTSKRAIFASNSLAATMILRFGELAQPIVNMISMPVLSTLAILDKMPQTFMGIQKGTANVGAAQIMSEGVRAMNSSNWARFEKKWSDAGYFAPNVSEANKSLQASRSFNGGPIAAIEKAVDSSFVNMMSKPADWAETQSRRAAMYTGAVLAKRLYPELDDNGVTIFARTFMDKSVGNFHAAQRPVFFQGTLGVALGLFQTYALTLMQNVYRGLELKNYKALGKAALTQSALFGTSSLPGFSAVSEQIGEHFSDDNIDLTTGSYRALPDSMADLILYGLPSNLGPGINTRGDADVRFPGLSGENIVALNFAKQSAAAIGGVAQSLKSGDNDVGRALLQGLSLQSISRPIARMAEVGSGYSLTQKGNTVQTPEEVWTFNGIASRVMATRPLQEVKLREAMHLNSYYGSIDRDARNKLTDKLRIAIRNETLSDEKISEFAEQYMRHGGTATGWRSAYQTALAKTDATGKEQLVDKLRPDNALMWMLNSLD